MNFLNRQETKQRFIGKNIAIVGSGPSSLDNKPGFVDSHDIVVRVNNYKLFPQTGARTDVYYSFFGTSVHKSAEELTADGVTLCICKCPNAAAIKSPWHTGNKSTGVDYRYIYEARKNWWFCDTYIPELNDFLEKFELLGRHIPTTGFAAIIDMLSFEPKSIYLTGFDFFKSKKHNVDDPWREKNMDDPFRHMHDKEREIVSLLMVKHQITADKVGMGLLACD